MLVLVFSNHGKYSSSKIGNKAVEHDEEEHTCKNWNQHAKIGESVQEMEKYFQKIAVFPWKIL